MNSKALTWAAAVTVAWIGIATISSELSASFKVLMTSIGGHHWIGKSISSIIFFFVFFLLFSKLSDDRLTLKDAWLLIAAVVVSGLAILFFYVQHA